MKRTRNKATTANRRLAKKRVQWVIEALYFVSTPVLAESYRRAWCFHQAPTAE